MKVKRISHQAVKKKLLQDADVNKKYQDMAEEYQLIDQMLKARKRAGVSKKWQKECIPQLQQFQD